MDQELLKEAGLLVPVEVQEYLRSRGWQQESVEQNRSATYRRGDHETEVPLRKDFADFSRRSLEVLDVVARVEGRTIRQVLDDLLAPAGDVISLRVQSERVSSGTVPLADRLRMGEATRQMLLAAAHSEISPQAFFPRMTRTDATELLGSVLEAQSQRGSYVSRIIVPVEPEVTGDANCEAPFSRRVVCRLMSALEVVSEARALGDREKLLHEARSGVSANLLAALAAFQPTVGRGELNVSVSWSRNRTPPDGARSRVAFPESSLQGLAALAESLRNRAEAPNFELVGYVTRLDREDPATSGRIVVIPTEDAPGVDRVQVELDANDYQAAIAAHGEGRKVRIVGTLAKVGRRWTLRLPYGFELQPTSE